MRRISAKYILACFLTLIPLSISAQETTIKVIDSKTSKACEYATVMLSTLDNRYICGEATNSSGEVKFDINNVSKYTITYLGYTSFSDTIKPGQIVIVKLENDLLDIETVVVTGQYKPKAIDKSIYRISVLDAKTIHQRGANNLAEALSAETGIRVTTDPSLGTSIKMQGMSGENIKYLIDGIPLIGRVGGIIDLSQINMENIDHIEIVRGPMAVQYGTGAIAGVVNIITKTNNYLRNQLKTNTFIDNKGNYNLGITGSIVRGSHSFELSGTRNLFQGIDVDLNVDSTDTDGHNRYMEFKPKLVYNANLGYTFRKNDFRLKLKSHYMNTLLKHYSNYIEKVVLAYDADYHTTRSTNSVLLSDKISEDISYSLVGSYTYFGRETDQITSDLYLLTKKITKTTATRFDNIMSRGTLTFEPENKKYSLMTGWDINMDSGSGDKLEGDAKIGDYAFFLSAQYLFKENIAIQPGVRVIYNTIYGAPVIPSLNLQWEIFEGGNLRLSYARGFRAPSLKELYLDFKDTNHDLSGNKDLKAETTNSYNASFDYSLFTDNYTLKLEPEIFYNDGKDAITLIVTDASANSATSTNLGGRRTFGGELNTALSIKTNWMAGAGISRTGETFDEEGEGNYLPIVYYNNFSLRGKYIYNRANISLLVNLKYYGKTPLLAPIPENEGGGYYRVFTDPFGDLEITATKNLWKNRLTIVAGAKNLLNNYDGITSGYKDFGETDFQEAYIRPLNYGRTIFIKLNFNLSN